MGVLTIRAHKRFALRLPVELERPGRKTAQGLLIEVSQKGARVSNLGRGKYEFGDPVTVMAPGGIELVGTVRWAHDSLAGIQLARSLHVPELNALLDANRREAAEGDWNYGT